MPRSTRELAKAIGRALAAGDLEQLGAELAEDVVMYGTVGGIDEHRVMHGRDDVVAYFGEVVAAWEQIEAAIEAIHVEGDAAVLLHHETAHTVHTDVPVESDTATFLRVRDGKVVEIRGYMDQAAALAALERFAA